MSSALLVLIVEKTKMIGILKALGMRNKSIRKVFVIHGGILIASGFMLGNILAIIIIATQNQYGFLKLPQQNYYLNEVPMYFPTIKIVLLNLITFILCYTSMILPSIISTKISPVKAISSEI
jgi:lipoprotein-releasing system permease protein